MSIKSRLEAMERKEIGPDPLIAYFKTSFEAKDGSIDYEIWRASIIFGLNACTYLKRNESETFEEFEARVQRVAVAG